MRTYPHTADETHFRQHLAGPWSDALGQTRQQLSDGSTADFNLTTALDVYFEGVCIAWAFNDGNALGQLRQGISTIAGGTIDQFPPADVQRHSTYLTLAKVGVGAEPATIRRYAEVLNNRARQPIRDRDPHAYTQDLLDALTHLALGHDGAAHAASVRAYQHLHHPRTPPSVHVHGIPHAIQAVVAGDQAALNDAVTFNVERYVDVVRPLQDRPVEATSLLDPTLSLVCRLGSWRGTAWPDTPYVLAVPDSGGAPGPSPTTAGQAAP